MEQDGLDRKAMLGRGVAFPLQLAGGTVGLNAYESQVMQSIRLILDTGRGERVMRTRFVAPPATNSMAPAVASGSSYCEIW